MIDAGEKCAVLAACNSNGRIPNLCPANRHGSINAYKNYGCRCDLARAAWSRYMKDYRLRRLRGQGAFIDATGTRRRVQALLANGWTTTLIGERLGVTGNAVSQLSRRNVVRRSTASRVAKLYNKLADTTGPSTYNATAAARAGWLTPIWWDDDTIDDPNHKQCCDSSGRDKYDVDPVVVVRAIAGDPPPLMRRGERLDAVKQLHGNGLGYDAIAERIHVSQRQVHRDLTDLGLTGKGRAAAC